MRFSIIVPAYNAEKHIDAALDSVCAQTYGDWECICVDDGSTDQTGAIIDGFKRKDPRIRVIHQVNGGEGAARNAGLSHALGDWFLFLDADDLLHPELLSCVAEQLEHFPAVDVVGYDCKMFSGDSVGQWGGGGNAVVVEQNRAYSDKLISRGVCLMAYNRRLFGDVRFGRLKIGADLVYVSECLVRVRKAVVIPFAGYGYRIYSSSMCHRERDVRMMQDTILFRQQFFENLLSDKNKVIPLWYIRTAGNQWFESTPAMLWRHKYAGEWRDAWDSWYSSLNVARKMNLFTPWQRFVLAVLLKFKSRLTVWIFSVVPFQLKRIGLHR